MDARNHLPRLIQQLYAAPGTTHGWGAFLERVRVTLHGSAADLIHHNLISRTSHIVSTTGIEAALDCNFARHRDTGRVIGCMLQSGRASTFVVSVHRSQWTAAFDKREVELFAALIPHIGRALQLDRRLIAADAASHDLAWVINESRRAVYLLDAGGRISFMNPAAARLTATHDGLAVEGRDLRASRTADTTRLRAAIGSAAMSSNGHGIGLGGAVTLDRPSGRRSLIAQVCPVPRHRPVFPASEPTSVVVLVTDPDQIEVPDENMLCALFGLTRAEARLTRLLAQGETLLDAANRLGVRRETARSRVKTIFGKTHTHRQAELVRLVLTGAPGL